MSQDLPSAGFHYGVPFETYRDWPAVNSSLLKPLRGKTPAHCKWAMDHPKESDEMDVGSALHVSCFEPARFERDFYLGKQEYKANTKEGKVIQEREMQEAAGRTYLRRKAGEAVDCDSLLGMSEALRSYKPAKKFLEMPGECEVCAVWKDAATGLMCKCRFDKLVRSAHSPMNRPIIVELKSTRDGSEWAFERDMQKLGYAMQAAYYMWGVETLTGEQPAHVFIGCENGGPYVPFWGTLNDQSLQTGALEFRECLKVFAECQRSGQWPGYSEDVRLLTLPAWANRQEFNNE